MSKNPVKTSSDRLLKLDGVVVVKASRVGNSGRSSRKIYFIAFVFSLI